MDEIDEIKHGVLDPIQDIVNKEIDDIKHGIVEPVMENLQRLSNYEQTYSILTTLEQSLPTSRNLTARNLSETRRKISGKVPESQSSSSREL